MTSCHTLDHLHIAFDDHRAVAHAGLLLPATLAARLGLEAAANEVVDLRGLPAYFQPGAKIMTLLHALLAGADCIDDADMLRSGATAAVLGHRVLAPSTLGTFLRSFTFGHVRQLDRLSEIMLTRAWELGAGPGEDELIADLDSTICQVHGNAKQGAAYGYTKVLGYHPCWPAEPTVARSCTSACARARRTPGVVPPAWSTSWSVGSAAPVPAAASCCGWTPASGPSR